MTKTDQAQSPQQEGALPDPLKYDETVLDYIEAQQDGDQAALPEPPSPHVETLRGGEQVMVKDPARESFELDHNAPVLSEESAQIAQAIAQEVEGEAYDPLKAERQAPLDEAMQPIEQEMSVSEMVQDGHLSESDMLDDASIMKRVLDPVDTE